MPEGGGARLTNGGPCTTSGRDEEDARGDESGLERPVITWVRTFQ